MRHVLVLLVSFAAFAARPATAAAPLPALAGPDAVAHLQKHGEWDSFARAVDEAAYDVQHGSRSADDASSAQYDAVNRANALRASFAPAGVQVRSTGERRWQIGLRLQSYGYGDALIAAGTGTLRTAGNRVEITRTANGGEGPSPLVEWYVNSARGLEQGFTLSSRPDAGADVRRGAAGPLRIVLDVTGDLRATVSDDGRAVRLRDASGEHVSTYDHLEAWDATGRKLPARMALHGAAIALEVDDRDARYPVTVDPTLWQQQARLVSDTGAAHDQLGWSVAISGDRAIVGARQDNGTVAGTHLGYASIFARTGATWKEEKKLVPADGVAFAIFGYSVAISGDTAIVGAPFGGDGRGKAYVYVRGADGDWTEQAKLAALVPTAGDRFGYSVAIDGDHAVVGSFAIGAGRTAGAAYAFARSAGVWSLPIPLVPADPAPGDIFGFSVAISGDTAIVGAPGKTISDNAVEGAAYLFTRSGSIWTQQGSEIVGGSGVAQDFFGRSVGISGNTAVVEFRNQLNAGNRGAYFFDRTAGAWSERAKLSQPNVDGTYGAVAISGSSVLVGTAIYERNGDTWTRQAQFTSTDGGTFNGFAEAGVAISGTSAIIGAFTADVGTNVNQGAAYVYLRSPDTDGDGLPDDWETNGVTVDGTFIDLPQMGADPRHKDIFVHVDWMANDPEGHVFRPNPTSIRMVIDSFAVAPVSNPDGRPGINLHADLGPTSIMKYVTGGSETWGALSRAGEVPFREVLDPTVPSTVPSARTAMAPIKQLRFLPAGRRAVFHYALYCKGIDPERPGGASIGVPAAPDFVIAYSNQVAPLTQAATFMHELGHNMGLGHGGGDVVNYKPNYISIMNYRFRLLGTLRPDTRQRSIDFSRRALATLDETSLDEFVGISDPDGHRTTWNKDTRPDVPPGSNKCLVNWDLADRLFYPTDALDWNCDGLKTVTRVAADLNSDGKCVFQGANERLDTTPAGDDVVHDRFIVSGPDRVCDTTATGDDEQVEKVGLPEPPLLKGFDDWANPPTGLVYDGGGPIGRIDPSQVTSSKLGGASVEAGEPVDVLPPEASDDELLAEIPPGLLAETSLSPLDVVTFAPQAGIAPLQVVFDGSASTAVNGSIVSWQWDFGDGSSGTGAIATHSYTTPGRYLAKLTVTDDHGYVNLVPLLQRVEVADPASVTPTPSPVPTPSPIPTRSPRPTETPPAPTPMPTDTPIGFVTPTPVPTAVPTPGPLVGEIDPTFDVTAISAGASVAVTIVQPDGRILIGGEFKSAAGCARRNVARLMPDGSCDPSFDPGLALATDAFRTSFTQQTLSRQSLAVHAMALQPDGRILVGVQAVGGFVGNTNTTGRSRMLFRLNADGSLDPSFDVGDAFSSTSGVVNAIALRPDGKIVIGGAFLYAGPVHQRSGVARLNHDGTVDGSFVLPPGQFFDGPSNNGGTTPGGVNTLALQSDGRIVITGLFGRVGTELRGIVARLEADGAFDPGFNAPNPSTGVPSSRLAGLSVIQAIGVLGGDQLVVVGYLTDAVTGQTFPFARLNADGSRDDTFSTAVGRGQISGSGAQALAVQSDGKIVVGGELLFNDAQGNPNFVARLDRNGALDPTYVTGTNTRVPATGSGQPFVHAIALQANDEAIIAGDIDFFDGAPAEEVVRLNTDGGRDPAFDSGAGNEGRVMALARQPDGKILVGVFADASSGPAGTAPRTRLNAVRLGGIGRLNADGSTDTTFVSPFDQSFIGSIVLQPDGRILLGGSIRLIGSRVDRRFVRILANGTFDPTFAPPDGAGTGGVVQPDGKILTSDFSFGVGSIVRLEASGARDATFVRNFTSTTFASPFALLPDGRVLIIGDFFLPSGRQAGIARLLPNGDFDPDFDAGIAPDGLIWTALRQDDGRIVIAGAFTTVNGVARPGIARLAESGALDTAWVPANPDPAKQVRALALQADGKLVVGSYHKGDNFNLPVNRVFRLLPADGSFDPTFPVRGSGIEGIQNNVNGIVVQADGDIVIGGEFDVVDGRARLGLARIVGAERPDTTPAPSPSPSPTAEPTAAPTPTPAETPTPTPTPTPTATPLSATATPRATATAAPPTPSSKPTPVATPTPFATATPTPTPPTAPGSVAAIECYRARPATGSERVAAPQSVLLDDGFEAVVARVLRATSLCNVASIDDATDAVAGSAGVLVCHNLERAAAGEWATPAGFRIVNRFGEQAIEFVPGASERALCVTSRPAAGASTSGAIDVTTATSGRLRCRRARAASLAPAPGIALRDAFEDANMRVRALRSLCAPVALDGEASSATGLLACYDVARMPRQPGFRLPPPLTLDDELGRETLTLRNGQRTVCVPTERRQE